MAVVKNNPGERPRVEGERGSTAVREAVVSSIAAVAAGEVEGVLVPDLEVLARNYRPGIGEFFDSVTGETVRRSVSVEISEGRAIVDLVLDVVYGNPVPQVVLEVREAVIRRVRELTGLEVPAVNITVRDVVSPNP